MRLPAVSSGAGRQPFIPKRRARESNPQLLAQRLISNQLPNHSVTLQVWLYSLQKALCRQYLYDSLLTKFPDTLR